MSTYLHQKPATGKDVDTPVPLIEQDKKTSPELAEGAYPEALPEGTCPEPVEGMPRSEAGLRVSEEEYWEKYYEYVGDSDFQYEWNNGILEEKPAADFLSSQMYMWFFSLLNKYLIAYPVAKPVGLNIGFRLTLPEKVTIRKPDLAVISNSNPIAIDDDDCWYKGTYDVCIEFLSDAEPWEVERQRAGQLAAKLRALGIEP